MRVTSRRWSCGDAVVSLTVTGSVVDENGTGLSGLLVEARGDWLLTSEVVDSTTTRNTGDFTLVLSGMVGAPALPSTWRVRVVDDLGRPVGDDHEVRARTATSRWAGSPSATPALLRAGHPTCRSMTNARPLTFHSSTATNPALAARSTTAADPSTAHGTGCDRRPQGPCRVTVVRMS